MNKLYYNNNLKLLARNLRNSSTLSEVLLWNCLRKKKLLGYKFLRQKPIGNYIVDFYCTKLLLVIEIDGFTHDNKYEYDINRQKYLENIGLVVLRFRDEDVKNNLFGVIKAIEKWVNEHTPGPS